MSSATHSSHGHAHAASHGTWKGYTVGFILSLVLTLASFGAVMTGKLPHSAILPTIAVLAVVQLIVQLFYFLHLGTAPGQRANLAIFLFTGLIIAIVVGGSLWVLHNMNENMMHPMPMSMPSTTGD
ncbi:MAG TPA: cytochrome o ubiquinol oxidase subunit IV [Dyella sp.]|uniref:cytochrome o ubiquinol oxidase subunit IV n=1 Tax=Dyella sp. TaxID=1869338 RepID=UPI002F93783D